MTFQGKITSVIIPRHDFSVASHVILNLFPGSFETITTNENINWKDDTAKNWNVVFFTFGTPQFATVMKTKDGSFTVLSNSQQVPAALKTVMLKRASRDFTFSESPPGY